MTSTGMNGSRRRRGLAAPFALPAGFAALLVLGAFAAGLHGRLPAGAVLALAAVVVAIGSMVAEPAVAPLLGAIGWLTAVGFAGPPYGQLRPTGPLAVQAVAVMAACAVGGTAIGLIVRRVASSYTLWIVDVSGNAWPADAADSGLPAGEPGTRELGMLEPAPRPLPSLGEASTPGAGPQPGPREATTPDARPQPAPSPRVAITPGDHRPEPGRRRPARLRLARAGEMPRSRLPDLSGVIGTRRRLAGVLLAAGLPLLTAALVAGQPHLGLADDLLIYLVAVVAIAVVGGFWPAVLARGHRQPAAQLVFHEAAAHADDRRAASLLALLLFVTVAVTVSSVVHLAARRAIQAARSGEEAASLLALAQTVLGGADTPAAVLEHLTSTWQGRAELAERVRASGSGYPRAGRRRSRPPLPGWKCDRAWRSWWPGRPGR